jgi:hypothetical protein
MKTKLLKKVRKRFEILHLPKGVVFGKDYYDYNLFQLVDLEDDYYSSVYVQLGGKYNYNKFVDVIFDTEKECIDYLKSRIIVRLKREGYKQRKNEIIRNSVKKIWSI